MMRAGTILTAGGAALALALGGCASGGVVQRLELSSTLTGTQAVPGPGDMDGTGTARVRVNAAGGQICWELNARGIDPATAAHIHRGEAGSVGPPVVPMTAPVGERSEGCASVDAALAAEMIARPHAFYVNVHNAAYPQGAIRGQLRSQVTRPEPRQRGR
jgi:hypothetical protein